MNTIILYCKDCYYFSSKSSCLLYCNNKKVFFLEKRYILHHNLPSNLQILINLTPLN